MNSKIFHANIFLKINKPNLEKSQKNKIKLQLGWILRY